MHESKVNTKTSEVGKNFSPSSEYAGSVPMPFGMQLINRGDVVDHAHMRTLQLTSVLRLMQFEGGAHLRLLSEAAQGSLMWLSLQIADELEDLVDILVDDVKRGVQ